MKKYRTNITKECPYCKRNILIDFYGDFTHHLSNNSWNPCFGTGLRSNYTREDLLEWVTFSKSNPKGFDDFQITKRYQFISDLQDEKFARGYATKISIEYGELLLEICELK